MSAPLSPREREVLTLLAEGLTSTEAARRLVLSRETVQTHVRNAMRKLRARTRTHAIAIGMQLGELEPDLEAGSNLPPLARSL